MRDIAEKYKGERWQKSGARVAVAFREEGIRDDQIVGDQGHLHSDEVVSRLPSASAAWISGNRRTASADFPPTPQTPHEGWRVGCLAHRPEIGGSPPFFHQ